MSRQNKVNRDRYTQRGRLTPDEAAREQVKQREAASPRRTEGGQFGERMKSDRARRVTQKDKANEDENEE